MSILINGVKMPKNCARCFVGDRTICRDECPIDEIPPHGKLIDADNFIDRVKADVGMVEEDLSFEFKDGIWSVLKLLETQPTVIEAEE